MFQLRWPEPKTAPSRRVFRGRESDYPRARSAAARDIVWVVIWAVRFANVGSTIEHWQNKNIICAMRIDDVYNYRQNSMYLLSFVIFWYEIASGILCLCSETLLSA
jgi:hypothetical protein